jgi:hypothetical protein
MSAHDVNGKQTSAKVKQIIQQFVSVYFKTSIYNIMRPDLPEGGKYVGKT